MKKSAIILFSGGLDSTTVLAIAKSQGFTCHALSFDYAQRHRTEVVHAEQLAKKLGVDHQIFNIDIGQFGGSALTDANIDVPDYSDSNEIPATYVPARNIIFLSIALGLAEVKGATDIFLGISSVDYSGYPDCRPEFLQAFIDMANLGTKAGSEGNLFQIHAPLIHLSKAETIKKGLELGIDYSQTLSCYQATEAGLACGRCDSCALRKKGFEEAGVADPTRYFS